MENRQRTLRLGWRALLSPRREADGEEAERRMALCCLAGGGLLLVLAACGQQRRGTTVQHVSQADDALWDALSGGPVPCRGSWRSEAG